MFDVVVVGGGHAGVEAAAAAARMGQRTAIVSLSRDTIGAMSCNPAIGGLGKGHIVREIDAFDGAMARAADAAAIHHRMLNASKGRAVWGPRVQADRPRYARAIRRLLVAEPLLAIIEGEVSSLAIERGQVTGVVLADDKTVHARSVVLATGTFLGGRLFCGNDRAEGGRVEERAATRLAWQLRDLGLRMGRLKTGTPPRLDGRTIDWARLAEQPSDDDRWTMSAMARARALPQVACAITRTNARTHDMIRANLDQSPLFSGSIEAQGPRYCPSIEDKIHRFGDRDGHQVFLEPEGLDDPVVYPNGISTSLPSAVQADFVRSIDGLERADIVKPGYAVEYDYLDPRSLDHRLALAELPGLFCAGQINGTTGYEEAAGQGLVAGINAALTAREGEPLILDRASSYIGVMIDDLVLQGVTEPYRMLTARAEYRLALRADNAETRLGTIADSVGCLSQERRRHQADMAERRATLVERLQAPSTASDLRRRGAPVAQDGARRSGWEWLRFEGVTLLHALEDYRSGDEDADVAGEVIEDARYAPYVARQAQDIERTRADEQIALPTAINFAAIPGLSIEMVERLALARPQTLGAAARIQGVTPAAVAALHLHARAARA